ncbi:MAG: hypothetical protein A2046_08265 [Bacteroidetes bacterium GWA2_30_7]|nr:MAG: hypothetical protein A2046_08265 [Bacteroidetes bacterium GWA2_30_7]
MRYVFFILFTLNYLLIFSQNAELKLVTDTILFKNKLNEITQKTQSIESNFIQEKHLSMLSDVITSEGIFKFKKENKIRWEYQKPFTYLVIINNDKISIKDENKTNTFDAKNNKVFEMMNNIISNCLKGTILNSHADFNLKYFESTEFYVVKMIPKKKEVSSVLSEIYLYFDKTDLTVSKIKMQESSDDFTLIVFKNKKHNINIGDEAFIIN